jgi:hypothetical protein
MPTTDHDLKRDSRGAIMVLGIVFGALLVGALWHVASVGDAIIWRERAQDAADAGAFENAVWNARGMNVIVAINIIMSLVLMILVIWRTVLLLLTVALVLGAILCVFTLGAGCGFTSAVAQLEVRMLNFDPKLSENIVRILAGMNAAEMAVATATPIVGLAQANINTSGAYDVSSATTQSASLLPSVNWKGIDTMRRCLKGLRAGEMPSRPEPTTPAGKAGAFYRDFINQPRMGIGVSLPVQVDSYGALCEKAGEAAFNNLAGVLERMNVPSGAIDGIDKARDFMGFVAGNLPGLFCAPIGGPPAELTDLVGQRAVDSCKSELPDRRVFVAGDETEVKYRDDDGKLVDEKKFTQGCAKKKKEDADKQLKQNFKTNNNRYNLTECGQPAKVWEWAVNGNYFMRSFGQVAKDTPMLERDDRGLEVADGRGSGNLEQATPAPEITAHAEIFFDCGGNWMSCKTEAMWQLRWRARLRRVQPLQKLLSTAIEPALVSTLTAFLNESGNRVINDDMREKNIPHILVPKVKDTWVYRKAKTEFMRGAYGSDLFSGPGAFVVQHASGDGLVH